MALLHPTFCWTEKYSVNIAVLDRQHEALFRTLNQLKDALTSGQGGTVVDDVLKHLFDYAFTHFATEEKLMTEHAFPGLETHRAEHKRFAQTIEKLQEDCKAGKTGVPVAIMLFMQSLLQEHFLKADKAYSAYLNARGVR